MTKKQLLFFGIVILLILEFVFLITHSSDGLENYQGIQKEAAIKALELESYSHDPFKLTTKDRVERVFPTPKDSQWYKACEGRNQDPNSIIHYSVTISHWLFIFPYEYFDVALCRTDPGTLTQLKPKSKEPLDIMKFNSSGQPPQETVTDDAQKSSISGIILIDPQTPAVKREIILRGTTKDGELYQAPPIANTFTDSVGHYQFNLLQPGKYSISIVDKKDETMLKISEPEYHNTDGVLLEKTQQITDYNYDYSSPYINHSSWTRNSN